MTKPNHPTQPQAQDAVEQITYGFDPATPDGDYSALTIHIGERVYTYIGEEAEAINRLLTSTRLDSAIEVEKQAVRDMEAARGHLYRFYPGLETEYRICLRCHLVESKHGPSKDCRGVRPKINLRKHVAEQTSPVRLQAERNKDRA